MLEVLPKSVYLYLSFQIVQQVVQTKESAIDIQEMAGTTVPVHFSNMFILGVTLA